MKKNVTILDMLGNIIGTTYPKRAKGLIKSGRACIVDGETVQLTSPSDRYNRKRQEDINMSIDINGNEYNEYIETTEDLTETKNSWDITTEAVTGNESSSDTVTEEITANESSSDVVTETITGNENSKNVSENAKKLLNADFSLKDILHNLDTIREDSGYINQALQNLEKLPYTAPVTGAIPDSSVAARAEAIADIVKCRETTNQMMIKLYAQMYTDYMA